MLREYTTRPVKVLACIILEKGKLSKLVDDKGKETGKWRYIEKAGGLTCQLDFSVPAGVEPVVGDAIIQQSKEDIYHCPKAVFEHKYAVQGMMIR